MGKAAAFRVGFLTSALNPKIALFYGSVFATALPAHPSAQLVAAAVGMVYLNSVIWHCGLAVVLSQPGVQRAYLRHYQALNRVSGALVGVFGARLIASAVQEWRARAA
jgi:threonine efflux protein